VHVSGRRLRAAASETCVLQLASRFDSAEFGVHPRRGSASAAGAGPHRRSSSSDLRNSTYFAREHENALALMLADDAAAPG
jgi:hypothetical protein